jgi:hypothetical protein
MKDVPDTIVYPSLQCSSSSISSSPAFDDNASWYEDIVDDVITIRLRTYITPGKCEVGDYRGCTLEDVNADLNASDDFKPEIKVHMIADDFPNDYSLSNATLRMRGRSNRSAKQKSYRIKIDSKENLWRHQRYIQLNKHTYDLSRLRNHLTFNIFRGIENFATLRTQFVHLYIDNIDYGLYTHVENVGEEYLINRGFNKKDNIYKAQEFSFAYTDAFIQDIYGNPVDLSNLDATIEPQEGNAHIKLIQMIQAINNNDNNFNDVFNKYFDRNNYLTWLALNILTDNKDTMSQNFYLYNREATDKFYFLPWDYDGAWGFWLQKVNLSINLPKWKKGIGAWYSSPLHYKFLQSKKNRDDLVEMVHYIRDKYLNYERVNQHIDSLKYLVKPYISTSPDIDRLGVISETPYGKIAEWEEEVSDLYNRSILSEEGFYKSLEEPLPFWINALYSYEDGLVVQWTKSDDFQNDKVLYNLSVSTSPKFEDSSIIIQKYNLSGLMYIDDIHLEAGKYYVKVVSMDEKGNYQDAFNQFFSSDDQIYPSTVELIVQ